MRVDLAKVAEWYHYEPPEVPQQEKGLFQVSSEVDVQVRNALERAFLRKEAWFDRVNRLFAGGFSEGRREVDVFLEYAPQPSESYNFPQGLSVSLYGPSGTGQPVLSSMAEWLYVYVSGQHWYNAHRVVRPDERQRGLGQISQGWMEVAARTHAFQTQAPVRLWLQPYQLDVIRFFQGFGFEATDPDRLAQFLEGRNDHMALGHYDARGGRRDWAMYLGEELYRVPMHKDIPVAGSLTALKELNKTA